MPKAMPLALSAVSASISRRTALIATLALALTAALAPQARAADPLPAPTGEVILTVSGAIAVTNSEAGAAFDLEMLKALGIVTFETTTIWTEGPQAFEGVPVKALMDRLGATGTELNVVALNEYAAPLPASDLVDEKGPILAFAANGKELSVRDKGPLWVVYPFDLYPELQSEATFAKSVWQVARIEVK